jgi:hypothetical protein
MLQSARYVPITLMQYVLRWGQRSPDPQHVTNAFRITTDMFKNGKPLSMQINADSPR